MFTRVNIAVALATALYCLPSLVSVGHAGEREYKIKAAYLYNLAKFIEWPTTIGQDFVLCTHKNNEVNTEIETIEGKNVHGSKIRVVVLDDTFADPINCHMLFYADKMPPIIPTIELNDSKYAAVLTVGETNDFLHRDGLIALVLEDNHIRLKINLNLAKQRAFKISGKLLEIADVVE